MDSLTQKKKVFDRYIKYKFCRCVPDKKKLN